jgi:hypothetical protein
MFITPILHLDLLLLALLALRLLGLFLRAGIVEIACAASAGTGRDGGLDGAEGTLGAIEGGGCRV